MSFNDAGFSEDMLAPWKHFEKPTDIQSSCWPVALAGRDVIGIAATGSGKTLAFILPALVHIKKQLFLKKFNKKEPLVLVLAPTRELAMQTHDVAIQSGKLCNINSVCIYGGVSKNEQKHEIALGTHIVVATPGRLLDLISEDVIGLSRVSYLVLDEADRMLDFGFEKDIRKILSLIPKEKRQTLLFSATWPTSVRDIAAEYIRDPVRITIGSTELTANHQVTQLVEVLDDFAKTKRLEELLKVYHKTRKNRILVFALYKKEAARLEQILSQRGWNVQSIHSDKSQYERTAVVTNFKNGTKPLLIATDVAARGLDIPDVEYVINYTFPLTIEDYVHRIGRTGRAGKLGIAHTFFTTHEKSHAAALVRVLREANQVIPADLLKFPQYTKPSRNKMYGTETNKSADNLPMPKSTHITFGDD